MSDRELLEAAARAAGIDPSRISPVQRVNGPNEWIEPWNPLTDDGDALRLAVKLRLRADISPVHIEVTWFSQDDDTAGSLMEWNADDPCAATRRAIVRAAAAMKGST